MFQRHPNPAGRSGLSALLLLMVLAFGAQGASAQSCLGKAAGDVCRASAGGCDIAETCVSTSTPMYQPTEGSLQVGAAWNYTMGYGFTPNKTITVTALGGFFNGTRTVYLFNRSTGAVLASASVTSANNWAYANLSSPVILSAGTAYSVGVYLAGSGAAYRSGTVATPRALADATINGSCYRYGTAAEPCSSTMVSGTHYGMADLKYFVGGSLPLYQPTDGTLSTDGPGDYVVGYAFTPNKAMSVNALGGFFNGTRTVYLYNRSTGAVLASATVSSANNWAYTAITPVVLSAGTSYTVAVYLPGTGGAYRAGVALPSTRPDATIEGSCYRPASTVEPCGYSGLITGGNYGMADLQYSTGNGLTCPADVLKTAGTVCRGASGTCDVTETCSGSSAACPTNLFKASGITCDDGQLCTYNDVCNGAGSCGGTTITCGGGNACSTTVCNGTSTCESAKVYCTAPPSDCYNTLGTCNTTNGSCSYTVKVGAPCGTRGTCQANGTCYTPPLPVVNGEGNCSGETIPAPTPIGCDSCDPSHPCVVDTTITVPKEYQTCSGYTPRKGDVVVHEAVGLTQLLIRNVVPSNTPAYTHVGVFLDPQPPGGNQNKQMVRHHALNMDALADAAGPSDLLDAALAVLSLNKNSSYCKTAQIDPYKLLDSGGFAPGVPNMHTADMVTEKAGDGSLFWQDGVARREVILAANRATGEQVANGMLARSDYYSLNSLLDDAKGMSRLNNGKPGTNCASSIMSCLPTSVPRTQVTTDKMKNAAFQAFGAIRKKVLGMDKMKNVVTACKWAFCGGFLPFCPMDCDGIASEIANGIADQVIACILFGPTANGCECTRDNRKWHFANWASGSPPSPTQDDIDWVNGRMTDVEFYQDASWTGGAAAGQAAITIYPSNTYLPGDILKSSNYPSGNSYPLIVKTNATRKYGHCWVQSSLSITPSPTYATTNTAITWTATMTGGDPNTVQYAFFRRRVGSGTAGWIPSVYSPGWQGSNSFSWTPAPNETGDWEIYAWVKDAYTSPSQNTYGYSAGANAGVVKVVAPLTVTGTTSPSTSRYGTEIAWTATASGGVQSTIQYALFRRRVGTGTSGWIPSVNSPSWQGSNRLTWTPNSTEVDSWEIYIWVKDVTTTPTQNTYGYAAGYNAGVVQVTPPDVVQIYPAKGWVDGYNTQHIWGWACDPDYPTESNRVDVYTTSGTYLGTAGAFIGSSSGINSACLGGTAHYFDFYPSGGIASGTHFNVWSIDLPYATPGNANRKIGGSGSIGDGTEFVIP